MDWWKLRQRLWFSSGWKPSTVSRVFIDLLSNSPNGSPLNHEGKEKISAVIFYKIYVGGCTYVQAENEEMSVELLTVHLNQ